jgi:hypothetical protein
MRNQRSVTFSLEAGVARRFEFGKIEVEPAGNARL